MNEKLERMPANYRWVVERGLVGFEPFTALQPWYFVKEDESFDTATKWRVARLEKPCLG